MIKILNDEVGGLHVLSQLVAGLCGLKRGLIVSQRVWLQPSAQAINKRTGHWIYYTITCYTPSYECKSTMQF